MSALQLAALAGWGMLVGLDLVSVAQVMVARPFVAGTVAGFLVGDATAGAIVGAALELFALDLLPVGGARYPDFGPAAVAAVATAAGAPGVLGLGPAIAVGLAVAYTGEWTMQWTRWLNSRDVQRRRAGLDAGELGTIRAVHVRGIVRDALRALGVTLLGLALALGVRRWLPLDVRGVVLVGTVALGAALAVATVGALRLGGRGKAGAWLVAGLVIGGLWVLLR
jgi:mannose/fructose/N-acetylgalactosamine-specific phosphotransferase system component IIC